jgi:hypothetical protein
MKYRVMCWCAQWGVLCANWCADVLSEVCCVQSDVLMQLSEVCRVQTASWVSESVLDFKSYWRVRRCAIRSKLLYGLLNNNFYWVLQNFIVYLMLSSKQLCYWRLLTEIVSKQTNKETEHMHINIVWTNSGKNTLRLVSLRFVICDVSSLSAIKE